MADSRYWRRPGRRDEERRKFTALMRKVEKIRLRDGITKTAMATAIAVGKDVFFDWLSGRSLPSKTSIAKIDVFVRSRGIAKVPGTAPQ
jgi:DNA-binding transcriptional regulator YiaG